MFGKCHLTRGGGNTLKGNDVPGWDTVAPVYTGWTSQHWKGERLSVWAPFTGPAVKIRVVYNTWIYSRGARAPPDPRRLGFNSGQRTLFCAAGPGVETKQRTGTVILTTPPRSTNCLSSCHTVTSCCFTVCL